MSPEQSLFLALLRDHVHGTALASPAPETDWDALLAIADAQALSPICYVQLRELPGVPAQALERFHGRFLREAYLAVNRRIEMERVFAGMAARGLAMLPFKGWVVQEAWPVPELRSMGDIDFLIRTEDRRACDTLMRSLGCGRFVDNHAVWTYTLDPIRFEVHDHMFYEHLRSQVDYRSYFDRAWDFASPELDASFHLLYLLTHLAKHITNKGMGFRAFLDLVFWCRAKEGELRWDWIRQQLDALRLLVFAETCFAMCRSWFHVEMPLAERALEPGFIDFVTEKACSDGTFGLDNEQNEAAGSAKEIAHVELPYLLSAALLSLRRLFPSYSNMRLAPWYGFVDGRPWLLPAAWIYRWFYCLFRKGEESRELLAEPFQKRALIDQRMELLRKWGL